MTKRDKGYAMVLVICVLALVTALCLALLLAASLVFSSAQRTGDMERCRIMAVTLSQALDNELTDEKYTFENESEETTSKAINSGKLWFVVKDGINNAFNNGTAWYYYNEDEQGHRGGDNVFRSYELLNLGVPGASAEVVMHWESDFASIQSKDKNGIPLITEVTCTLNGQSCTIRTEYELTVMPKLLENTGGGEEQTNEDETQPASTTPGESTSYEQWKWSMSWRE